MTDEQIKANEKLATKRVWLDTYRWMAYVIAPIFICGYCSINNFVFNFNTMILPLLLFAGIADAVKDTLAHHFDTSIFSKLSKQYWDPSVSWKNKNNDDGSRKKWLRLIPVPVIVTDAWHLFKGIQTVCIIAAVYLGTIHGQIVDQSFYFIPMDLVLIYLFYKWPFTAFYDFVLLRIKS